MKFQSATKYRTSLLLVMVILLQVIFPVLGNITLAAEVNVIDSIKITNDKGENQDSFRPQERIRVDVTWSIKSDVKSGDTFSLKLPEELRGFNGNIDLKDANGNNFGTGTGSGGLITFKFSDIVEKLDNISGFFYIQSQIKSMDQQGEIEVPLKFEVNKQTTEVPIIVDTGTDTGNNNGATGRTFDKWGSVSEEDPNKINWIMEINGNREDLSTTTITDEIGKGHELIEGSISVYDSTNNSWLDLPDDVDGFTSSKDGFQIDLYIQGEMYLVNYKTRIIEGAEQPFTNKATLLAWNKEPQIIEKEAEIFGSGGGASGDLKQFNGKLKIIKQDKETKEALSGAIFELIDDENNVVSTLETDGNGEATTEEILGGVYTLKEIKAPEGYKVSEISPEITLDFKENDKIEKVITNVKVEKIDIPVTKIWKDNNSKNRPESIKVDLLQNGVVIDTQEVTAETEWKYTFTNLEEYDENGGAYEYTIKEQDVEGYKSTIEGHNITNLRVGKTEVSGTKIWKDNNSKDRPESIKVDLLQNGVVIDTQEVTTESGWKYSFTDLEQFDENGKEYEYTVKEQDVPGYKSEVNGFDITNIKSNKISIKGTKTWLDDNDKEGLRPDSITVILKQNGEKHKSKEVFSPWTYEFTDLDKYDQDGNKYEYTIEEANVPERYTSEIVGYDIINSLWKGKISIIKTVVRGMDGLDNEGLSAEGFTFYLYKILNDEEIKVGTVTTNKNGKAEFEGEFTEGLYVLREKSHEGFVSSISGGYEFYFNKNSELELNPIEVVNTKTEEPQEPQEPTIGLDDNTPKGGTDFDKSTLPKTGEKSNTLIYLIGLTLITLGYIFRRKEV